MDDKTFANVVLNDFFKKYESSRNSLKCAENFPSRIPCDLQRKVWDLIHHYKEICRLLELCIKEQEKLVSGEPKTVMGVMRILRIIRFNTFVIDSHFANVRALIHKVKINCDPYLEESEFACFKRFY